MRLLGFAYRSDGAEGTSKRDSISIVRSSKCFATGQSVLSFESAASYTLVDRQAAWRLIWQRRPAFFEPTVVNGNGAYRQLFHSKQRQQFPTQTSFNRKDAVDSSLDRTWHWVDNCIGIWSFLVFNACGGGIGSGLGRLLLERLSVDNGTKSKLSIAVWAVRKSRRPSWRVRTQSCACTLCLIEHTEVTVMMDNEAICDI